MGKRLIIISTLLCLFLTIIILTQVFSLQAADLPADCAEGEACKTAGDTGRADSADRHTWLYESIYDPKIVDQVGDSALQYDSRGRPHIVYGTNHLYYAHYDGQQWHFETVDPGQDVGALATLVLDSQDRPHNLAT